MKIAAHRGNRSHVPENTFRSHVSAYTAGADILILDAQLTKDGEVVVVGDPDLAALTGQPGTVIDHTYLELRAMDFGHGFVLAGRTPYDYTAGSKRPMRVSRLLSLLDALPRDAVKLIELKHASTLATGRREEFVRKVLDAVRRCGPIDNCIVFSKDPENLRLVRALQPRLRAVALESELLPAQQLDLALELGADGLMTELSNVATEDGELTPFGQTVRSCHAQGQLPMGALLYPKSYRFTASLLDALSKYPFVYSLATASMLEVEGFVRAGWKFVEEPWAGKKVRREYWSLGYAKANEYCHVYPDNGIHVVIKPYPSRAPRPSEDELERKVRRLEEQMWYAEKSWPFYSGGGVGLLLGIAGDFVAEVDYTVENTAQATTLEMAALNVDPGAHREPWKDEAMTVPNLPESFRDKDSFFDPHGAPPYVGVEHDENDGFRINWNLGSEYDNNQYGPPVGDGVAKAGRLRLERRGPYFSAYYRNDVDAPDWVCAGATRNDSMNSVVYLRCVGKRWRQEKESDPSQFEPIIPNHFTFKNLVVTRFEPGSPQGS